MERTLSEVEVNSVSDYLFGELCYVLKKRAILQDCLYFCIHTRFFVKARAIYEDCEELPQQSKKCHKFPKGD